MYINLARQRKTHGTEHFKFLPLTFVMPEDMVALEYAMAKDAQKLWIVKPVNSSGGERIFLTQDIKDIGEETGIVVSQYVDNPLLINGFKFDLRIFVAMTCINPLRIYIYEEGLTRFATEKYDLCLNP